MPIERLPTHLEQAERDRHAREVTHLLGEYATRELALKEAAKDGRDQLKELQERIDAHARAARTGIEDREVEVRHEPDDARFIVRTVRVDDGEEVRVRPMTDDEIRSARQRELPLRSTGGGSVSTLRGNTRGGQPS